MYFLIRARNRIKIIPSWGEPPQPFDLPYQLYFLQRFFLTEDAGSGVCKLVDDLVEESVDDSLSMET